MVFNLPLKKRHNIILDLSLCACRAEDALAGVTSAAFISPADVKNDQMHLPRSDLCAGIQGDRRRRNHRKTKRAICPTARPLFSLSGNKAFKCFLFSDPLWYPSSPHPISWHAIKRVRGRLQQHAKLGPIQAVSLNAEKHATAPIRPATVIRNEMENIDKVAN